MHVQILLAFSCKEKYLCSHLVSDIFLKFQQCLEVVKRLFLLLFRVIYFGQQKESLYVFRFLVYGLQKKLFALLNVLVMLKEVFGQLNH